LGLDLQSEVHCALGRCDVIYAMELKLDGFAQQTLEQIVDRNYLGAFKSDPRKKMAIGINFSSESRSVNEHLVKKIT
jgi:Protein of unknown function (DUF1703).